MLTIFLDIPKAFDTTLWYKIMETVYNWHFWWTMLISNANFLSNRLFGVLIGDTRPKFTTLKIVSHKGLYIKQAKLQDCFLLFNYYIWNNYGTTKDSIHYAQNVCTLVHRPLLGKFAECPGMHQIFETLWNK